jgi:hypothetical protein
MIKIDLENQGWRLLRSEEDLKLEYPPCKYGEYRPQPFQKPDAYPCYFIELCIMDNRNGADHAMLAYLYDFEYVTQPE